MINNLFKGVVHLPDDEAFKILKETGEYSDGNINIKYDPNWLYITPTNNIVTLSNNQTITGRKTFTDSIYLANTDGTIDRIAHINNNFIIYSGASNGLALLNIDEGLGKISAFNKELAFKEDIAAAAGGSIITLNGEIQSIWEVTNSVQRVTDTIIGVAGESRVYGFSRDSAGVPTDGTMVIKTTPTMYGLPRYNDNLNIKSSTPVADLDCVNKQYAENNFLSLTGGTITGNLTVTGNIIQQGETYETHAEKVYSKNDYIYLREGNTSGLAEGEFSGIEFVKYDGTNNGRLVVDNNGIARVGDIGDEQPLATREETPTDGGFAKWDADTNKFITVTNVATTVHLNSYLPKTGGTMTGNLTMSNSAIRLYSSVGPKIAGTSDTINVSNMNIINLTFRTGNNYLIRPSQFSPTTTEYATLGTANFKWLKLYVSDIEATSMTLNNQEVLTTAGGTMLGPISLTNGIGLRFNTNAGNKYLVYGDGTSGGNSVWLAIGNDDSSSYYKFIDINGKLYSDNKEVLTVAGGTMTGMLDFTGISDSINLGQNGWLNGKTSSGNSFGVFGLLNSTRLQVGGSYPSLELKGKDARPKYFVGSSTTGTEVALLSDIPTVTFDESTGVLTITG